MARFAQIIIFIIGLAIWGNYIGNNSNGPFVPPPMLPGSGVVVDLFKRFIELLAISSKIREANAAEKSVTFPANTIVPFDSKFYPESFINKYKISTSYDVDIFDRKAIENIELCTIKANRISSSNINAMRDYRYSCLKNVGYDENDLSYVGGKHGSPK